MNKFKGFTESESLVQIPEAFFRHLLTEIDDMDELKITLFALWRIASMEGRIHFLRRQDFSACLPEPGAALEKAVRRGSLIEARSESTDPADLVQAAALYFVNSPRGRAAAEAYSQGKWKPETNASAAPLPEQPNVFKLYEENIGPLTPLIADAVKDAEQTYSAEWVIEALEIAVKNNKRNWKYVEAILKRWKEDGHAKKQDRRDAQEDGRRYAEGEYADYIEH